ncbi:MAG: orotidine-5'-phosphate decarboxylase [Deltaproteobacteria bacterium]|nr:orotidine-5'-phosphate decarboxylase [Deltaproteobacteria bacterium]
MKNAKDYIIFALDVDTTEAAKKNVEMLAPDVGMFKVGLELFIRSGPDIVNVIKKAGAAGIFLDLKLHDIPETVYRSMRIISDLDVDFVTVHCADSKEMITAAVEGSRGKVKVLGVSVLTHIHENNIRAAGFKDEFCSDISKLVLERTAMAKAAGSAGIICSGHEVKTIKSRFGSEFIAVTPGIRPDWGQVAKDDQKRVMTPAQAIKNGSDYLVIGRPIRDAEDPGKAAIRIKEDIETVL